MRAASRRQRERTVPIDYLRLMRPSQWVKNLAVLAGPMFGLRLLAPAALMQVAYVFAAFCLISSAVYAINDAIDAPADARHPTKRTRPVARGAIAPAAAVLFGAALAIAAVLLSWWTLVPAAVAMVAVYFVLMMAYSFLLKTLVLLDVIAISVGFVLRATAGAQAVAVEISPWLIICTFMICMFMGFGKRRCELAAFENTGAAEGHRRTLMHYTPALLDHLISVTAGIAIITFVQYTMDSTHRPPFAKERLLYTLPLVAYGVFRYAMLVQTGEHGGPTEILLHDRPFLATVVLWGGIAMLIVYAGL